MLRIGVNSSSMPIKHLKPQYVLFASLFVLAGGCASDDVCCPRDSSPCFNARLGGSAPSLAECPGPSGIVDGTWHDDVQNGCPVWTTRVFADPGPGDRCCGCRDGGPVDAR